SIAEPQNHLLSQIQNHLLSPKLKKHYRNKFLSSFLLFFSTSHHHRLYFYAAPLKKECLISSSTVKEGILMLKLRSVLAGAKQE
ncbi:hypothetical protein LINPERHAP1_LOCUS36530, partial [Linum perenne]